MAASAGSARSPHTSWDRADASERLLLIPSSHASMKKRVAWHQRPFAGCLVLAVFSLFGLACVSLPSFESPGNITVFRASEQDARARELAGWHEDLDDPPPEARHAVTLAVRQDREGILAALKRVSDPDSPAYGRHLTQEQVAEIATPERSRRIVRAYLDKVTSALPVSVRWSPGGDFVRVEGRLEELDRVFGARFRRWERRLRGVAVHATHRTREIAVPKEVEAHLDGILGALHLPTGQLQHVGVGGRAALAVDDDDDDDEDTLERRDSDEDLETRDEARERPIIREGFGTVPDAGDDGDRGSGDASAAAGESLGTAASDASSTPSKTSGGLKRGGFSRALRSAGLAPSAYSDREPIRVGKPPTRRWVNETEWVLREARALAAEAGGDPFAVEAFRLEAEASEREDEAEEDEAEENEAEEDTEASSETHRATSPSGEATEATEAGGSPSVASEGGGFIFTRRRRALLAEALPSTTSASVLSASTPPSTPPEGSGKKLARAERLAKRAAETKARERRLRSREKAKLEDKANAMFQKFEDEMREMKTLVAEAVRKDEDLDDLLLSPSGSDPDGSVAADARESEDSSDPRALMRVSAPDLDLDPLDEDLSGDGEERGLSSSRRRGAFFGGGGGSAARDYVAGGDYDGPVKRIKVIVKRADGTAASADDAASGKVTLPGAGEDAPPVLEAGSAAARAAQAAAENDQYVDALTDERGAAERRNAVAAVEVDVEGSTSLSRAKRRRRAARGKAAEGGDPTEAAASAARGGGGDAGLVARFPGGPEDSGAASEAASEDAGDGGYYEYEFNYDEPGDDLDWPAFEEDAEREGEDAEAGDYAEEEEDLEASPSDPRDAALASRSPRVSALEERLASLVTPDKALSYYGVPRTLRPSARAASVGVGLIAGDVELMRATTRKYAAFFNVTLGEIRAESHQDAISRYAEDAAEAEAADGRGEGAPFFPGEGGSSFSLAGSGEGGGEGGRGGGASSGEAEAADGPFEASPGTSRGASAAESYEYGARTGGARSAYANLPGEEDPNGVASMGLRRAGPPGVVSERPMRAPRAASTQTPKVPPPSAPPREKKKKPEFSAQVREAVAAAVSEAVEGVVDAADALAEGVGAVVEHGDDATGRPGGLSLARSRTGPPSEDAAGDVDKAAKVAAGAGDARDRAAKVAAGDALGVSPSSDGFFSADGSISSSGSLGDAASARVEKFLDVQAAVAAARGAPVDLLVSTPEQHYGWEPLDIILSVAASRTPQSVLSLAFGGAEKGVYERDGADGVGEEAASDEEAESARREEAEAKAASLGVALGGALGGAPADAFFGAANTSAALEGRGEGSTKGSSGSFSPPGSGSGSGSAAARGRRGGYVRRSNSWDTHLRVDTEIAKLGLRGVTVVAASGDNGPFSHGIPNPYASWSGADEPCAFSPSFPASMPHVTSVGGTNGGKDPFKPERAAAVDLGSKISSGGGFSSIFPQPEWQKAAVERYLKLYSYDLPPESFFNASNRAYPDLALAAEDVAIIFSSFEDPEDAPNAQVRSDEATTNDAEKSNAKGRLLNANATPSDATYSDATYSSSDASDALTSFGETIERVGRASESLRGADERLDAPALGRTRSGGGSGVGDASDSSPDAASGASEGGASSSSAQQPAGAGAGGLVRAARHYLTESSGTSYSAPLFAGMVAAINDARLAAGKSTLGFVNPALYALHRLERDVFRDVKEGSGKCPNQAMTGAMVGCCKHGFRTGKGWDPLTGLGSVDFERLMEELLKLP